MELDSFDHEVFVGADVEDALEFFFEADAHKLEPILERVGIARAVDSLRSALDPFGRIDGVWMPASFWLVRAVG